MNLYPAIDLFQGKVVRLTRGDFRQEKVYSEKPEEIACEWERQGAAWIHVVDLEGAKTGVLKNKAPLLRIRQAVKCKIQFGGGVRDLSRVEALLAEGIDRLIIGTKAIEGSFLKEALEKFGRQIAVGLDVRGGQIQTEGWMTTSQTPFAVALKFLNKFPLETIIYTDIQKDGMLAGPNFQGLEEVLRATKSRVILSGGVSSLEDIEKCAAIRAPHFEGAIIGKALYEHKLNLREALAITQRAKERKK